MDATEARRTLYEVMNQDQPFESKAEQVLTLGEQYLDVENAHLTEIHADSDYWEAIASTDPPDGEFPTGLSLDLGTTYCRRVLADGESIALHDAPEQGWTDDPAYETHGLHCYHGTPIVVEEEPYGTVCFVSNEPREKPFSDEETLFAELIARMLEHELRRERTAAKIERLEQFTDVLVHDLRNPLSVAKGHLNFALEDTEDEHITTAANALDRIQSIISNVLTMARQGRSVEGPEEVQLAAIVEECWKSVSTVESELTVEGDLRFRADPARVQHLFENLFRNAVEHGDESVTVRVGALANATGFYIEDDGSGIPEGERASVFERGHTTETEGMGLGLAIVDAIVAAHDWQITVTESAEEGARFEIRDVVVVETLEE
jgi:K+-sensing histidine kinase KdpD